MCYDALKAEVLKVGVELAKEASNMGFGGPIQSLLGVPIGSGGTTKRFDKANRLMDQLSGLPLDCAFKLANSVGAVVQYDVAVAHETALLGARMLDARMEAELTGRLRVTAEKLRASTKGQGLGVVSISELARRSVRGLGLRVLDGPDADWLWRSMAQVDRPAADQQNLAFAKALREALGEDGWTVDFEHKLTFFRGEVASSVAGEREWVDAGQTIPLPRAHPRGPSMAMALKSAGPSPSMSAQATRVVAAAMTGAFFQSEQEAAVHGACPLCAKEGDGLAHSRVCPQLVGRRWAPHNAAVRAIAGFVGRTQLCAGRVEVPIAEGVRADAVITDSQGRTFVVEVKTVVMACASYRNRTAAAVFGEKERLAVDQYGPAPACANGLRVVVIETCSLRVSEQAAELFRQLQQERDDLGSNVPGANEDIFKVVGAAVAEALGENDTAYDAMVAGAQRRASGGAAAGTRPAVRDPREGTLPPIRPDERPERVRATPAAGGGAGHLPAPPPAPALRGAGRPAPAAARPGAAASRGNRTPPWGGERGGRGTPAVAPRGPGVTPAASGSPVGPQNLLPPQSNALEGQATRLAAAPSTGGPSAVPRTLLPSQNNDSRGQWTGSAGVPSRPTPPHRISQGTEGWRRSSRQAELRRV